jgi:hypothetical protein
LEEGPKKDMYLVESNFGEKRMCVVVRRKKRVRGWALYPLSTEQAYSIDA